MKTRKFISKFKEFPFTAVATLGLVGATTAIVWLNTAHHQGGLLQEGLQTCFNRVGQTYTSKLIQDNNSFYMDKAFHQTTEECFGETMSTYEKYLMHALPGIEVSINQVMTDVHWFHQKIALRPSEGPGGNTAEVLLSNIGSRFEKLESTVNKILEEIDTYRSQKQQYLQTAKSLFYLFVFAIPFLLVREFIQIRRRNQKFIELETNASNLLEGDNYHQQRAEGILQSALALNNLTACTRLFNTYRTRLGESSKLGQARTEASNDSLAGPALHLTGSEAHQDIEQKIEEVWNSAEEGVSNSSTQNPVPSCELNEALGLSLDHASSKLFTSGTRLDFSEEGNPVIAGDKEKVSQIIYNCIVDAINAGHATNDNDREIKIIQKQLGKTVIVDILCIATNNEKQSIDFEIARELMSDIQGRIEVMNDQTNNKRRVRLIFNAAKAEQSIGKKLVALKKGKKKDLFKSV